MDYDMNDDNAIKQEISSQISKISVPLPREIGGLFFFLIIFTIIIPYFLLSIKNNFILLYYFSNLDLIANVLNHWNKYFDNLYFPNPLSEYSFISSTVINFIALLGISTMVSILALKNKNIFYGVAAATTALLITYLIPTTFIYIIMLNIDNYASNYYNKNISNIISVLTGIITSLLFVFIEVALSQKYMGTLAGLYENGYKIIKKIK